MSQVGNDFEGRQLCSIADGHNPANCGDAQESAYDRVKDS
jgi:hypothetical protein